MLRTLTMSETTLPSTAEELVQKHSSLNARYAG